MSKIAVRGGHTELCTGASALLDELTEDRKIKDSVIKYLKELGEEVLDCTPPVNYTDDMTTDMSYGVNKANNWGADLFVSIHLNKAYDSYNGAIGTEVCVYSPYDIAQGVVNGIAALGFKNRGQKVRTGLYELRHTDMKSMIIETCFVEATEDVALYKKIGPDEIGKKIAEAITNKKIENVVSKFPLALKMKDDAMTYSEQIKIFNVGDLLTADAENRWAYSIELDGKRCWVEKANVKLLGESDERYKRYRLQVTEYPCRVFAKEVKPFYKNELITVRDELSGYYYLDIDGQSAYIRKNVTTNR